MNINQIDILELMAKKSALKEVELWLNEQYVEIETAIYKIRQEEASDE